jgi:hypothetical protein
MARHGTLFPETSLGHILPALYHRSAIDPRDITVEYGEGGHGPLHPPCEMRRS